MKLLVLIPLVALTLLAQDVGKKPRLYICPQGEICQQPTIPFAAPQRIIASAPIGANGEAGPLVAIDSPELVQFRAQAPKIELYGMLSDRSSIEIQLPHEGGTTSSSEAMFTAAAKWTFHIEGKTYELTGAQIAEFAKKHGTTPAN